MVAGDVCVAVIRYGAVDTSCSTFQIQSGLTGTTFLVVTPPSTDTAAGKWPKGIMVYLYISTAFELRTASFLHLNEW